VQFTLAHCGRKLLLERRHVIERSRRLELLYFLSQRIRECHWGRLRFDEVDRIGPEAWNGAPMGGRLRLFGSVWISRILNYTNNEGRVYCSSCRSLNDDQSDYGFEEGALRTRDLQSIPAAWHLRFRGCTSKCRKRLARGWQD
jgi:hypothetical protein